MGPSSDDRDDESEFVSRLWSVEAPKPALVTSDPTMFADLAALPGEAAASAESACAQDPPSPDSSLSSVEREMESRIFVSETMFFML